MKTDIKVQIVEFGTVVRNAAGIIVGSYPAEDEAYEMLEELSKEVNEDV